MTVDEALSFLSHHQPMPSDAEVTEEVLDAYREVLETREAVWGEEYSVRIDDRLVGPLLGAFGDGTGCGLFEEAGRLLRAVEPAILCPAIQVALTSTRASVRYWALGLVDVLNEPEIVETVRTLAREEPEEEVRRQAVTVLVLWRDPAASDSLERSRSLWEPDELRWLRNTLAGSA